MLKSSNLEFTFEVGGSLVAMFLEPCHAVIHAKILTVTGINREIFALKN